MPKAEEKQKCIICKELINSGAKRCLKCSSWQDYRRHLSIGNTSISLLIAVISVFALASESVIKAFEFLSDKNHADISGHVTKIADESILVFLKNNGPSQAILDGNVLCYLSRDISRLNIKNKKMIEDYDYKQDELRSYTSNQAEHLLLDAGKSFQLEFSYESVHALEVDENEQRNSYCIIPYLHANGDKGGVVHTLDLITSIDFFGKRAKAKLKDAIASRKARSESRAE